MTLPNRRERQIRKTDILFAILAFAGVFLLGARGFLARYEDAAQFDPLVMAGVFIGITVFVALVMIRISDLDRRCSEDYRYQLVAQSAAVAALTTLLVNGLFQDFLLGQWFGVLSANSVIGVLTGSWALAYFLSRLNWAKA